MTSEACSDYLTKPLPGHAICNLGDAMFFFSGGILRSNIHRVVWVSFSFSVITLNLLTLHLVIRPPPKIQADYERVSLVFFTRPSDTVRLRALVEKSPFIAQAVNEVPELSFDAGCTAKEWLSRRIRSQRIKNYKVRDHLVLTHDIALGIIFRAKSSELMISKNLHACPRVQKLG